MQAAEPAFPSFGASLGVSFLWLGAVCLLAFVVLRWLARRSGGPAGQGVRVLSRTALEPRRSLYVIEVAERCFLVGVGEGPMAMLAELDPAKCQASGPADAPARRFSAVLAAAVGRRGARDGAES